ncbi:MAG: hypothetical protein LBE91_09015 [Tannerella sp.]|nr:hypothetical protein [Tannerella sp.]
MRKQFLLVGVIALMGFGVFLASCSDDDDDDFKGCTCTVRYDDGSRETQTISAAQIREVEEETGISFNNSCTAIENLLYEGLIDYDVVSVDCDGL